jgi:hypothetical protein
VFFQWYEFSKGCKIWSWPQLEEKKHAPRFDRRTYKKICAQSAKMFGRKRGKTLFFFVQKLILRKSRNIVCFFRFSFWGVLNHYRLWLIAHLVRA